MYGMEFTLQQEQKTVLSQKMIQSAEILQMDTQELKDYLYLQALENPLIDLEHIESLFSGVSPEEQLSQKRREEELFQKLEWLSRTDWQNRIYYTAEYGEDQEYNTWNFSDREDGLKEYLMSQLILELNDQKDYACMEFLICSLDSKGYLSDDTEELARRLHIDKEEMTRYLNLLWSLEPAGVGARSLQECLLLQLDRMKRNKLLNLSDYTFLSQLVSEYLELLGKKHFAQVASKLGVEESLVRESYRKIQRLNPLPGNSFSSRETLRYIKPDVTVVKFENYLEVLMNDKNLSHVPVSRCYLKLLRQNHSEDVTAYLEQKYRQVQWISRCMEERLNTLNKVSVEIVKRQKKFFEDPEGKRIPMSLKDIAQSLDLHESTISRAVKNKFLQCSKGVYPLSFFFVRKITRQTAENGKGTTSEQVKQRIRELIQSENKCKPLSDAKISELLKSEQLFLSRRTVAKYRSELMIPDTAGRRNRHSDMD